MPLVLDSHSPADSENTFGDMVTNYIDMGECQHEYHTPLPTAPLPDKFCTIDMNNYQYHTPLPTAPLPDKSRSSHVQTGLQTTVLLCRLPWHTRLADIFESGPDFIKV